MTWFVTQMMFESKGVIFDIYNECNSKAPILLHCVIFQLFRNEIFLTRNYSLQSSWFLIKRSTICWLLQEQFKLESNA